MPDQPKQVAPVKDEMQDELDLLADESAREAQAFLDTMTEVASGAAPDAALPMTLLAVSQVMLMGARLGAVQDVVPSERYEPDAGPDPDVDPLRQGVANLFEGLDDYAHVVDPLVNVEVADSDAIGDAAGLWSAVERESGGLEGRGRVLVRPSGTEPLVRVMVEAPDKDEADEVAARLVDVVKRELG